MMKHFYEKYNFTLLAFFFIFLLVPFLEDCTLYFPVEPFVLSFVLIAAVRIVPLPIKYKPLFIILAILACCFDLLTMAIFHRMLAALLSIFAYGIYILCFSVYIWALVTDFRSLYHSPQSLLKSGLCSYFLLGFLWMAVYVLIGILNPIIFSAVVSQNMPFFYFSFFALSLLGLQSLPLTNAYPLQYLAGIEAVMGQLLLFFFAVRLAILSYSYEARR